MLTENPNLEVGNQEPIDLQSDDKSVPESTKEKLNSAKVFSPDGERKIVCITSLDEKTIFIAIKQ
ncbi:hypothetical protein KW795_01920 [Candidatus Microgenomates bacterium]|nr:hypothetical protein [Candidatus Microgenomates bacterium]